MRLRRFSYVFEAVLIAKRNHTEAQGVINNNRAQIIKERIRWKRPVSELSRTQRLSRAKK